jgi:hypothetical protein
MAVGVLGPLNVAGTGKKVAVGLVDERGNTV